METDTALELNDGERIVGRVADMPPGTVVIIPYGRFGIGVFNVNGHFYALSNRCPHRGAPVCRGQLTGIVEADDAARLTISRDGEFLACPWHAWDYEIASGRSHAFPSKRIATYPVRITEGVVIVGKRH